MLLQVIQELMQHSIPNIQRKAMELLNNFLQQKEHTMVCSKGGIYDPISDQDAWPFGCFHLAMFINLTLLYTCTCKLILLHKPTTKKVQTATIVSLYMHMYNIWLPSVCCYLTFWRIIFYTILIILLLFFSEGDQPIRSGGQTPACVFCRKYRGHHSSNRPVQPQAVV